MSRSDAGKDPAVVNEVTGRGEPEPTRPASAEAVRRVDQTDPRAVRVSVAATSRLAGDPTVTVGPPAVPIEPPRHRLAGVGILGGIPVDPITPLDTPDASQTATPLATLPPASGPTARDPDVDSTLPLVDGSPVAARLEWLDDARAVLVRGTGADEVRTPVLLGPVRVRDGGGIREVIVDGWRIDIEVESERRAALRERSRRGTETAGRNGPLEIHAIIPGRIVAVSVAPGDAVTAGQVLLVLEAMKMQNELRAPREGAVERVAATVGSNVEVGDLLMVIT